ncbi:MAG: hypothetical protein ACI9MR_003307 [Myxococcota bacterium]|jgi:hypothetical protein
MLLASIPRMTNFGMTMSKLFFSSAVLTMGLLLWSPGAMAQIENYTFEGIEGVGTLDGNLDDRLGTSVNTTEHRINIADCEAYAGGRATFTVRINPVPDSYQYAVAYAPPGKTCTTTDTNPDTTGDCEVVDAMKELDSSTIEFDINFDTLIGNACDSGLEDDATVYIIIDNQALSDVQVEQIQIDIDLLAPSAPVVESATGGDGRVEIDWSDDINDSDETSYIVYYDEVDFTADALETVSSRSDVDTTSLSLESDSLENGVPVFIRIVAEDKAENRSGLSDVLMATPIETTDFWEAYQNSGGPDEGGYCFIATAAYGTSMAGELNTLRSFRDNVLMESAAGRAFVGAYYRWGRFAAAWIADKPVLKVVTRVLLVPLVWLAKLMLWLTPLGALMLLMLGALGVWRLRRRLVDHIMRDIPPTLARKGVRS